MRATEYLFSFVVSPWKGDVLVARLVQIQVELHQLDKTFSDPT